MSLAIVPLVRVLQRVRVGPDRPTFPHQQRAPLLPLKPARCSDCNAGARAPSSSIPYRVSEVRAGARLQRRARSGTRWVPSSTLPNSARRFPVAFDPCVGIAYGYPIMPGAPVYAQAPPPQATAPAPAEPPKPKREPAAPVPDWIGMMLKSSFFQPCKVHSSCRKNEVRTGLRCREGPRCTTAHLSIG